jgi:hypothetical protein
MLFRVDSTVTEISEQLRAFIFTVKRPKKALTLTLKMEAVRPFESSAATRPA